MTGIALYRMADSCRRRRPNGAVVMATGFHFRNCDWIQICGATAHTVLKVPSSEAAIAD